MKTIVFLVPFFLLAFACIGASYQYIALVQQWQPGVCSVEGNECKTSPSPIFTIHGLWPGNINAPAPIWCSRSQLDRTQINSLQNSLNQCWPDILNNSNFKFWNHEWAKHGTCSEQVFSQYEYFKLGIDKTKSYDLKGIFQKVGYTPNNQLVDPHSLTREKAREIGNYPGLRCNYNTNNVLQLVEVGLCFDRLGRRLIDCPYDFNKTCDSTKLNPPTAFTSRILLPI